MKDRLQVLQKESFTTRLDEMEKEALRLSLIQHMDKNPMRDNLMPPDRERTEGVSHKTLYGVIAVAVLILLIGLVVSL